MTLEWNCSRLVAMVASKAMPKAPPRLRIMLNTPDAAPDSCRAMPAMAMLVSGVSTTACPTARTMFGIQQLIAGVVGRHIGVHEAAGREHAKPDIDQQARIEPRHQPRHERNDQKLRQAGPGQHLADLLGVVALTSATDSCGSMIDRAVEREAER